MLSFCFFCALAAKWGPCEYSYGFLLHENRINSTQLPHPKTKGRPSKKAMAHASASGATLLPGTAQSEASAGSACPRPAHLVSQVCSAVQKLQSLLRAAQLGQLFLIMREQGAVLQMLQTMHLADFKTFFGLSLVQAYNLHQLAVSWPRDVGTKSDALNVLPCLKPDSLLHHVGCRRLRLARQLWTTPTSGA